MDSSGEQGASAVGASADGAALAVGVVVARAVEQARALAARHRLDPRPDTAVPLVRMAPELTGRTQSPVDHRADLYAFGASLYEWTTGRPPFDETDPLRLAHQQLTQVPAAPIVLRPRVPVVLSQIVMRLLEKEPERRYQDAAAVLHDLQRLDDAMRDGVDAAFGVGELDFPAHLPGPARPIGRETELAQLRAALDSAQQGGCEGVLIAGAAGTGKTFLAHQLRHLVVARRGRFASGKFDQYNRADAGGLVAALRGLGRHLLAAPPEELFESRRRILEATGPHAGVLACVPELRLVLGDRPAPPEVGPGESAARMCQAFLAFVGAMASRGAPVVLQLDDLQWADATSLRFLDSVLAAPDLDGVVVVGTCRDEALDAQHPLAQALARWQAQPRRAPHVMHLDRLHDAAIAQVLASMLRTSGQQLLPLATALAPHAAGNPFETVEAVNELRRAGLLVPRHAGWQWDADAVQRHLGMADAAELLEARVAGLATGPRQLVRVLSCLSHEISPTLARVAAGLEQEDFDAQLADITRVGVFVQEEEPATLRWRHDRLQQAVRGALTDDERGAMHLQLARSLARDATSAREAAEQYLEAVPSVTQPRECLEAAAILRDGAARSRGLAHHDAAARMLHAALELLARAPTADKARQLELDCAIDLHLALISLGRRQEADAVFERIERLEPDPGRWGESVWNQVVSLHQRSPRRGLDFGVAFLRRVGIAVPSGFQSGDMVPLFRRIVAWIDGFDTARELARADQMRPDLVVTGRVISSATWMADDPALCCSLILEAQRMWDRHGPSTALTMSLAIAINMAHTLQEWNVIRRWAPKMLAFLEARHWDVETGFVRMLLAVFATTWLAPLEDVLEQAVRCRKTLLLAGRLDEVSYVDEAALPPAFDCGLTLDVHAHQIDGATEFAERGGMLFRLKLFQCERQLSRALRGETNAGGSFEDGTFVEHEFLSSLRGTPGVGRYYLSRKAIACAVFGDRTMLARIVRVLAGAQRGLYWHALIHWLAGLSAAWSLQAPDHTVPARGPGTQGEADSSFEAFRSRQHVPGMGDDVFHPDDDRAAQLRHLDGCVAWLAGRAIDAPANFLHLQLHLVAERAWAVGDLASAATDFEQALRAVGQVSRPWHRALITERAARFHLVAGDAMHGKRLLVAASRHYELWGAHGKVRQLREEWPALAEEPRLAGGLDALAVLRASQAIAAERSAASLTDRVVEVLGGLTGATRVTLALRDADTAAWVVHEGGLTTPIEQAGRLLPVSAFTYASRTLEPLVVADALADDRFARDGYFQGATCCSLLVLPILHKAHALAMLVLENRTARGAFNASLLDAARMIATQLAVSLDSVRLDDRMQALYAAMNHAPDAILVADPQRMEYVDVNEAAARMFGLRREDVLRQGLRKVVDVHPGRTLEEMQGLYEALVAAYPQASTELHALEREGQPLRIMETTRSAVRRQGRWLITTVSRDVTDRERVNRELNDRVTELARSNRELEQFAYVTSHDLTEPLRMVASYAQLLKRRYDNRLGEDGREFIGYIDDGARRMKELIDDILLYSRAGRQRTSVDVHALDALLDTALGNLRVAIEDSGAAIERPQALPDLICDSTGIVLVFQNLIANALKFRGTRTPVVRVTVARDQRDWTVCVADNGIGIEPQHFERIFVIFQRLHGRDNYAGSGIGLSICKKVVESHRGRIWVESSPGAGARFFFTLPAAGAQGVSTLPSG